MSAGISFFPVITASGAAAAVAQIILLRELMVLFYGVELCMGGVLAAWLVWSAVGCGFSAGLTARHFPKPAYPGLLLISAALVLPLTLLFIRASSRLWGIVPGEIPSLTKLLLICLMATLPFSLLSGALFGLCWGAVKKSASIPLSIYVGEALGTAGGGLGFYLLLLARQSALTIVLLTSLGLLLTAAWFFSSGHTAGGRRRIFTLICACTAAVVAGLLFRADLDSAGRRLQWGPDLVAACDTPYQNLALLHKNRQYSVFSNGLWLFSAPDRQSLEYAVHPALLQHPAPSSILLLGGAGAGLPGEILSHPSVRHVDVVEPDPGLTDFLATHLPETAAVLNGSDKLTLHYGDAAEFIRTQNARYDVILMNMGDPINAQMNRFYTARFFKAVKSRLAPRGIFSFGVSGGEDTLGEIQIQFIGTIFRTLSGIFPEVSILPGNPVRFSAANHRGQLTTDPRVLSRRIRERGLTLSYVRDGTLRDRLEAFRLRYFNAVLQDTPTDRINRDFTPLCYAHALRLWTAQWHPRLGTAVAALTRLRPKIVWTALILVWVLVLTIFQIRRYTTETAVCLSVATVGGLTIGVQMVLLVVFQIMEGAIFLHLALIVALFMAGLAGGAGWVSLRTNSGSRIFHPKTLLVRVQLLICFFPPALAGLFLLIHGPLQSATSASNIPIFLFPGLSLLSGILGGIHFAAASATMAGLGKPVSGIGGRLYAFDLLGSACALLVTAFVLIPILGPIQPLPMFSAAAGAGLVLLYSHS